MLKLPQKTLIAVIHLPALPGSARHHGTLQQIVDRAAREAHAMCQAGFDAVIVENFGDAPFQGQTVGPHTVAALTRCVQRVTAEIDIPVGVNVLRNDARAALAVAACSGARFIRVNVHSGVYATDQGILEGRAAQTLTYRRRLGAEIAIFADVHVKHAQPLHQPDIALAAEETALRGQADAVIVSGTTTGRGPGSEDLTQVKAALPGHRVLVGSGATPTTAAGYLTLCDGIIVGSCLRRDGQAGAELDAERLAAFMQCRRDA